MPSKGSVLPRSLPTCWFTVPSSAASPGQPAAASMAGAQTESPQAQAESRSQSYGIIKERALWKRNCRKLCGHCTLVWCVFFFLKRGKEKKKETPSKTKENKARSLPKTSSGMIPKNTANFRRSKTLREHKSSMLSVPQHLHPQD